MGEGELVIWNHCLISQRRKLIQKAEVTGSITQQFHGEAQQVAMA